MRRGIAIAGQHDIQPASFGNCGRTDYRKQGLANGAIGRDEEQQLAALGPRSTNLDRGAVKAGQVKAWTRLADCDRPSQGKGTGRRDPFMQDWLVAASVNDRLAGSHAFQIMAAVMVSGWLMARQDRVAADLEQEAGVDAAFLASKRTACRVFLDYQVHEAIGLAETVTGGAELLYRLDPDILAL